jgi:hypothetical protein
MLSYACAHGLADAVFPERRVHMKKWGWFACVILYVTGLFFLPLSSNAAENVVMSAGQTIYVPAYSHIYYGNREKPFLLTVTLSIRNVSQKHAIKITNVDYYETQGRLLKAFLDQPITIGPLGSKRYILPEKEKEGGSGANFIVKWESGKPVDPPLIESIMIGAQSTQGISFSSRGQVVLPVD